MSKKGGAKQYLDEDDYGDDDEEYVGADYVDDYEDGEILDAVYDDIYDLVGDDFSEAEIVKALRANEYDPKKAAAYLRKPPAKPVRTPSKAPASSAKATPGKSTPATTTPATASKPGPQPSKPDGASRATSTAAAHVHHPAESAEMPAIPPEISEALAKEKPRIAVVTVGHVDAGKSTLMGHLLYDIGAVSSRTLQNFVRQAKAQGKGSFAFAWVLDEEEEERSRGVTMDVGVNHFETDSRIFTLLDAPGHRDFVPNTITAIAQADVAVLVVDATPGEYEMSISGGGQAKEHALLARNFGIQQLVVAVNKMDGPMVRWSAGRFDEIYTNLLRELQAIGFKKENVTFVPVSGLTGINLVRRPEEILASAGIAPLPRATSDTSADSKQSAVERRDVIPERMHEPADADLADMLDGLGLAPPTPELSKAPSSATRASSTGSSASHGSFDENLDVTTLMQDALKPAEVQRLTSWYDGPTLLEALMAIKPPARMIDKPLRLCISDVYKSTILNAVTVAGRLEGGFITPHTNVVVIPGSEACTVKNIAINGGPAPFAAAGDNVDVGLGGIEEHNLRPGQVICWPSHPIRHVVKFKAQIAAFPNMTMPLVPGQQFMLHSHTLEEPCNVTRILRTMKDGHTDTIKPRCLTAGQVAIVRIKLARSVCLDTYAEHKRLGRFMLRYGEQTVAAGMVLKLKR